jgi:hypothetical protein
MQVASKKSNHSPLTYGPLEDSQPSHYEFDAYHEKPSFSNRRAGEFEMPIMDFDDLHSVPHEVKPDKIFSFVEKLTHLANAINIVTSGATAIGSTVSQNENTTNFLQKLASFGAKTSMGVNSFFNMLNGHKKRDLSNVIGYAGEMLAAALAPYNVLGLIRGASFSTYQASNVLSSVKPMRDSRTYGEYVNQVKERLPVLVKKLFDFKTYKSLTKNIGFITGGWGSLLSMAGVASWAATGSTKLGAWIKGIGEVLIDSYQILPKEHWERKKQFYISSGFSFVMGSLCEMISKQRNNDPVMMALYFFGSGIGRMLYTISNVLGEDKYNHGGPKNPQKVNLLDFSKFLNLGKPKLEIT